ncbi:cell wall protein [Myxococcus sp. Y35]|uniref:cell wall protein n=1 Tax=Pseudomyxococcus flavus TaxID=3115648 RepID=UPI003CFAB38D
MPRNRSLRSVPSLQSTRSSRASAAALPPLEQAFRAVLREELAGQLSSLTDSLLRIAESLSSSAPRQPQRKLSDAAALNALAALAPVEVEHEDAEQEAGAPEARACAVIGCKRPVRSLGYCAAHYQKRRLMVASGRLHHAWTEDAAPNSIPDVILGRKRREPSETPEPQVTPEVVRPSEGPRVWVRKKGSAAAGAPSNGNGDAQPSLLGPASVIPPVQPSAQRSEREQVASIVEQWASEFRANKQRS